MSEESTGLKTREEVPTELTWNLKPFFQPMKSGKKNLKR